MNRKLSLIIIIVFVFLIAILLLVFLLPYLLSPKNSNNNGTDTDIIISYPEEEEIDIFDGNNGNGTLVDYAYITDKDSIELTNTVNKPLIIQLERRSWRDLKWSPDGNLLAVLGKNNLGVENLYVYSVQKNEWKEATKFNSLPVDSYEWKNSKTIIFTNGQNPDRWLHEYSFGSDQVLKISRVDGVIKSFNSENNLILFQNNKDFNLYGVSGEKLYELKNIINRDTKNILEISDVKFASNNNLLLIAKEAKLNLASYPTSLIPNSYPYNLQVSENNYYKLEIDSQESVMLTNTFKYDLICTLNDNVFLIVDYKTNLNEIEFASLNFDTGIITGLNRYIFEDIIDLNLEKIQCGKSNLLVNIDQTLDRNDWIMINNFENKRSISEFDSAIEVKQRQDDK